MSTLSESFKGSIFDCNNNHKKCLPRGSLKPLHNCMIFTVGMQRADVGGGGGRGGWGAGGGGWGVGGGGRGGAG